MFKDVLQHADLALLANTGLVIFFVCFLAIVLWALSRPKRDVRQWSMLPLADREEERQC